jgi:hypothetical protein
MRDEGFAARSEMNNNARERRSSVKRELERNGVGTTDIGYYRQVI